MSIKSRMIDPGAKPWRHDPPYKRIDTTRLGRRRVITLQDVQNKIVREPDPAAYSYDGFGTWTLRE